MRDFKETTSCRVCRSENLFQYLDLGSHPLANSYIKQNQVNEEEFKAPLKILLCEECGLSQLSVVVNPEKMFTHYLYVSSTPETFRDHCDQLAGDVSQLLHHGTDKFVLDIASNDGCLLRAFQKQGFKTLGVDSAKNLAKEANEKGIETICGFWSTSIALNIVERYGRPSIITGQNVFAHVGDVHEFVKAVEICLDDKGMFILEFPYLLDFIERNLFDTAYHEHVSYVGVNPVKYLIEKYGLEIIDIKRFYNIHGGTIRIIMARKGVYQVFDNVREVLEREESFGIKNSETYIAFAKRVDKIKQNLIALLDQAKEEGRTIWGYGASAKGNTLLNYFGINNQLIERIIDDNPKKWKYLTPGARIPICGIEELNSKDNMVDDLLLLAWNFGEEIQKRCMAVGYKGDFIYPVPRPERVKSVS
ncbi:SAM-dependent methyltransferase [Candidatus Scalindua japonica]|uniref:SAM-dependent methyltransferase n=1 Tax=Candidatus Scalindua japonica TaxID=1284222 RepID=A0A286U4E4_9BACT|nr:class I SAM-dependent methyltransferase [Candidatus Scalindua japonica]GAX63003.1 SAM-dependent methyltransferase [Candidatus Scalindua japonica]